MLTCKKYGLNAETKGNLGSWETGTSSRSYKEMLINFNVECKVKEKRKGKKRKKKANTNSQRDKILKNRLLVNGFCSNLVEPVDFGGEKSKCSETRQESRSTVRKKAKEYIRLFP